MVLLNVHSATPAETTTFPAPTAPQSTAAECLSAAPPPLTPCQALDIIVVHPPPILILSSQTLPFSSTALSPLPYTVQPGGLSLSLGCLSVLTASVQYLSATQKALNKGFLVDEHPGVCKDTGYGQWLTHVLTWLCYLQCPGTG